MSKLLSFKLTHTIYVWFLSQYKRDQNNDSLHSYKVLLEEDPMGEIRKGAWLLLSVSRGLFTPVRFVFQSRRYEEHFTYRHGQTCRTVKVQWELLPFIEQAAFRIKTLHV